MYSQYNEDDIISNFWKLRYNNNLATLVDIGANDGLTLSNSLYFIEQGWTAYLFEPSKKAYSKLRSLHKENPKVNTYNAGISSITETKSFYQSGSLFTAQDSDLVSTTQTNDYNKWKGMVDFTTTEAFFYSWQDWLQIFNAQNQTFDFITIDAEGEDWNILSQIDLAKHNCKILCVEWNSIEHNSNLFTNYANHHNLFEIYRNAINIIYAKRGLE